MTAHSHPPESSQKENQAHKICPATIPPARPYSLHSAIGGEGQGRGGSFIPARLYACAPHLPRPQSNPRAHIQFPWFTFPIPPHSIKKPAQFRTFHQKNSSLLPDRGFSMLGLPHEVSDLFTGVVFCFLAGRCFTSGGRDRAARCEACLYWEPAAASPHPFCEVADREHHAERMVKNAIGAGAGRDDGPSGGDFEVVQV